MLGLDMAYVRTSYKMYLRKTFTTRPIASAVQEIWFTWFFDGWFVIRGRALATINLSTYFELSISNSLAPITMKIWKAIQSIENGVIWS